MIVLIVIILWAVRKLSHTLLGANNNANVKGVKKVNTN